MNCQRFESVVSELARGQMMAAEQRGEALAHSDACEFCATRLRDEEMLTRGLRALAAEVEPLGAPGGVEANLVEAFRAQHQTILPNPTRRSRSLYWAAAIAAMLLVAISVVAFRWRNSRVDDNHEAVKQTAPQPVPQSPDKPPERFIVKDEGFNSLPVRPKHRRTTLPRPESAVANHVNNEIATDFIPLSYMSAASLQDGGQIVRVQLPRSALANFGLPVNMDRYNEKVKADVLVGVDGLAHAIRFVQ